MNSVLLREEDKTILRKYNINPDEFDEDFEDIFRMIGYAYDDLLFNEFGYEFSPEEIEKIPRIAAMKKDFESIFDHISIDEGYINYNHFYISTYDGIHCTIMLKNGETLKGRSIETSWVSKEITLEITSFFRKKKVYINAENIISIEIENSTL
ncbi:hypothetical protein [Macrococcus equi]|uniref:hypothetical protein n=1 Tax=Macrococcus equi TaxID=3395462 RepID=UPI0039BDEC43